MCPLRLILLLLSTTLAGCFVLKNLNSKPPQCQDSEESHNSLHHSSSQSVSRSTKFLKVISAIGSGFWTCVDMADGRHLWRTLFSSNHSH